MINHSPYVNVIINVGILEEGELEGKDVSIACSVHALHSNTVQKNIPLLCAEYEKCECVRMVCIVFWQWTPALPSCCINQAINSAAKITTL
jgi:hypothetical protein